MDLEMTLHETFRENLKRRRLELGMTQKEMAGQLGLSQPYIAEVESGKNVPTLRLVEQFASALNCPPLSLLVAYEPVTQ
jgi:transcriptional regulator with XRE-family HTH domain